MKSGGATALPSSRPTALIATLNPGLNPRRHRVPALLTQTWLSCHFLTDPGLGRLAHWVSPRPLDAHVHSPPYEVP